MKRSRIFLALVVSLMLCGLIAVVSCGEKSTSPTSSPDLTVRPYDVDGIRVNGTEANAETGEPGRTFFFVSKFGDAIHNGPSPDGNYWTRQNAKDAKTLFDSEIDKR